MKTNNVISALAALAQDSRLAIFRALVQAGDEGLAAGKIAEQTHIASSSVSFHIKELLHADMVTARHQGRYIIYTANFDTINSLIVFLTDNCCAGQPCLPALAPCTPHCDRASDASESQCQ